MFLNSSRLPIDNDFRVYFIKLYYTAFENDDESLTFDKAGSRAELSV